jgi:hypothetical protein
MRQGLTRLGSFLLFGLSVTASPIVATPGDTCAAATFELGLLPFSDIDTTAGRDDTNSYPGACADASTGAPGSSAEGADVYYRIRPFASCLLQVSVNPTGTENLGLYIASDCAPLSAANCITMDDDGGDGVTEVVLFSATAGTDYYILIDGNDFDEGTYSMAVSSASLNCSQLIGDMVAPTITNGPPPDGTVGVAYTFGYTSTGSPTFSVSAGGLPPELSLSAGGMISGTPMTAGLFTGTVTATNGNSPDATQDFSIVISGVDVNALEIPTLGEWGLIVLVLSLVVLALHRMR